MGKEIVYCDGCGNILREKEFARGLAHTLDNRHFCVRCRPLATPTLPVHSVPGQPKAVVREKTRSA
jgi:hypothetical protein